MKLSVNKDLLLGKASAIAKILPKKPVLESHKSILFSVIQGVLHITAVTDDLSVKAIMMCKADIDFSFGVDAKKLVGTIKTMMDPEVNISVKVAKNGTKTATIKTSTGTYTMSALEESDFLNIKVTDDKHYITATAKMLKECMGGAKRFTGEDSLRNLDGIHICLDPADSHRLIIEATDAFKVCRSSFILDSMQSWTPTIVTQGFADCVHTLLNDISVVTLSTDEEKITAKTDDYEISTTLKEGKFVNIGQFFKELPPHFVTLNRNEIQCALERILMYAPSDVKNPIMALEIREDELHIYSQDVMMNSRGHELIQLPTAYPAVRTGFNITFMLDIAKSFSTDSFCMYFDDVPNRPFYVIPLYNATDFVNSKFFIAPVFIDTTVLADATIEENL